MLPARTSARCPPATAAPLEDVDTIYVDDIRLCLRRRKNPRGLDLTGDVNGDCVVDLLGLALLAGNWLNSGLSECPDQAANRLGAKSSEFETSA